MTYRSSILVALILGVVAFQTMKPAPKFDEKEAMILSGVMQFVKQLHFDPKPVDDNFSKQVFKTYLERLDPNKRLLLQSDVDQLKKFELEIDDQVNANTLDFFDISYNLIVERSAKMEAYFQNAIAQTPNLYTDDFIELDSDKKTYAKTPEELQKRWNEQINYEIISRVSYDLKAQSAEDFDGEKKTIDQLKEKAIKDIKEAYKNWFKRMNKLKRSDRFETFISSVSNYFDPHTDYFSPKDKQDFDINMGGRLQGIGARLQQDGDHVKISSLVPGGPAAKEKSLEVNDIILKVTQESGESTDITGMFLDEVVQLVRGEKGTKVKLTVKKKDGNTKDITIIRDDVIIDETFARSVIMDIPGLLDNVGYIYLPKFYSTFDNEGGNSCAADIKKELEKLKENNVNGIILDLRNNSGGSLNDVVTMTGYFIEDGPIVQVKSRDASPYVHRDRDKTVQYDGPLIVMVNKYSASASEIIAAALQDYGRAIIVGGESTFGKGSVQRFFSLDQAFRGYDNLKPLGDVKMTVQKFYRVNGGSTQLKGVVPDIIFPDQLKYIKTGETEYDNGMAWTEIAPQRYNQAVVKLENLAIIKANSTERTKNIPFFTLAEDQAIRLKKSQDESNYPLNVDKFTKMLQDRSKAAEAFDKAIEKDIPNLMVKNMKVDEMAMKSDTSKIARNEDWIKSLKKDAYIFETLHIMHDMIATEKSFAQIAQKLKN